MVAIPNEIRESMPCRHHADSHTDLEGSPGISKRCYDQETNQMIRREAIKESSQSLERISEAIRRNRHGCKGGHR